jgi:hypothetical protein
MALLTVLAVSVLAGAPAQSQDLLAGERSVCLATGSCPAPAPPPAVPAGLMYVALGLIGSGMGVLRPLPAGRSPLTLS